MANANTNTSNLEIDISELNKAPGSSNDESAANSSKDDKMRPRPLPLKIVRNEDQRISPYSVSNISPSITNLDIQNLKPIMNQMRRDSDHPIKKKHSNKLKNQA